MTGMTDIDTLMALEAIKLLKARRDRAVDTKDWDTYRALHADHHFSHNDGFENWDNADIMIAAVKRLLGDTTATVHHSHTPEITFESPTKAKGIWAMEDNIFWMQGEEEHWLHGFGFYHETYEKIDGRWLFTSRQLKRTHVELSPGALPGAQRNPA